MTLARLRYQALPSFTGVAPPTSRLGGAAKERVSGDGWMPVVAERVMARGGVWKGEIPVDEEAKLGGVLGGPDKGPTGPCVCSGEATKLLWPEDEGATCVTLLVCAESIGWTWSAPWITIGGLCPAIEIAVTTPGEDDKGTCLSGEA